MRAVVIGAAGALACAAGVLCAAGPSPAAARAFTVDDLLAQESFGAAVLDPGGRWLVYEQRDPYRTAPRFDLDPFVGLTLGRLRVVDIRGDRSARPLLAGDPRGVAVAAFSPGGGRLAIYRLRDRTWQLGVATMATGDVTWFDVTPDTSSVSGRALQWRDENTLLVLDRPDHALPKFLQRGSAIAARLPRLWDRAAEGLGSSTAFGSGRYAGVRERRPPNRLLELDVETGQRAIRAEGEFSDLEVSPGGRRVALLETGPDRQPRPDGPVRGPAGTETEVARVVVLELATGDRWSACDGCDVSPNLLSWSPSGERLLLFARGDDGLWPSGALRLADAGRRRLQRLTPGIRPDLGRNPIVPRVAWKGETPLVYGRREDAPAARADWWALGAGAPRNLTARSPAAGPDAIVAGDGSMRIAAAGEVWEVSPRGTARRIAKNVAPVRFPGLRFAFETRLESAPPDTLWVGGGRPGRRTLTAFTADGARHELSANTGGTWAGGSVQGAAVLRSTDPHGVTTLSLTTRAGAATVAVANRGWSDIDRLRVIPIPHTGPAGEALTSWVYLPARADPHAPAPLLVRPYLGSRYATPPGEPSEAMDVYQNLRVLTGRGFAVLVPSLPAPPGGLRDPARDLAPRILGIVQAALDTPSAAGRLDPERMALIGHSFGGYTVMNVIAQTDCFRAAVSMNGVSDLTSYWSSLPLEQQVAPEFGYMSNWHTGVVEATQPELRSPPWRDPKRYTENSPLYAADRINTPLLLIHGAQDGVPMAQSEAMYSALFRQGKDALFVVYWGAKHIPTAPGDIRDVYARTFGFLDDQLALIGATPSIASPARASANDGPTLRRPRPKGCPTSSR